MCGIFLCTCGKHTPAGLSHRGPDGNTTLTINGYGLQTPLTLHFTHLSINSNQHTKAMQPIFKNGVYLLANAEIYNYKEISEPVITKSDCEVILDMYLKLSVNALITKLDGEFAFIIVDLNHRTIITGRDTYGVRPLFMSGNCFSSEAKAFGFDTNIEPVKPGFRIIDLQNNKSSSYPIYPILSPIEHTYNIAQTEIRRLLCDAVSKRLMGDSIIGCFLSGGLDSSLVCAIAAKTIPDMHAYTIGMIGSSDITAAKIVADHLNIQHHVYNYTAEEGIAAIEEVIKTLETYDVTTIRASIPQYLLSKKIKEAGDVRVLLSGEGSDELFGGYQYFKNSPTSSDLAMESDRLLQELYMYDNLRTDRVTSAWGLEVRVPFLDKNLVQYVRNIHPEYRSCSNTKMEKMLLRESFIDWLPESILFRPKEAFSDAVSSIQNEKTQNEKTWKEILADYINTFANNSEITEIDAPTLEAKYYKYIYSRYYKSNLVTEYWMPKWIKQNSWDPSATTIDCYTSGQL